MLKRKLSAKGKADLDVQIYYCNDCKKQLSSK